MKRREVSGFVLGRWHHYHPLCILLIILALGWKSVKGSAPINLWWLGHLDGKPIKGALNKVTKVRSCLSLWSWRVQSPYPTKQMTLARMSQTCISCTSEMPTSEKSISSVYFLYLPAMLVNCSANTQTMLLPISWSNSFHPFSLLSSLISDLEALNLLYNGYSLFKGHKSKQTC